MSLPVTLWRDIFSLPGDKAVDSHVDFAQSQRDEYYAKIDEGAWSVLKFDLLFSAWLVSQEFSSDLTLSRCGPLLTPNGISRR